MGRRLMGIAAPAWLVACLALPAGASATTFTFTGQEQTYLVPAGATAVHVEATGSRGGTPDGPNAGAGGRGARVSGTIAVTPDQTLFVEVGGVNCNGAGIGGPAVFVGGAGGGASDVRTATVNDGGFNTLCGFQSNPSKVSRLIVAAAGGGGGSSSNTDSANDGGDAGAPGGDSSATITGGKAATAGAGGAAGAGDGGPGNPGLFWWGGFGGATAGPFGGGGGGGGGGLFGGGGGGASVDALAGVGGAGGGGGSSLVPPGGAGPVITTAPASVEITPCTIIGTAAGESLVGTAGDDVICGLGGGDQINGRHGDDLLSGDDGDDLLIGARGSDELDGGGGSLDSANYGGGASQTVNVDLGTGMVANDGRGFAEMVTAVERVEGARNEQNNLTGDDGPNKLIGGLGPDNLSGAEGADLLRGEPERAPSGASDALNGDGGDDELFPGLGANTVDGGPDADTVNYGGLGVSGGVTVSFSTDSGTTTGALSDNLFDIEHVTGTPNADNITVAIFGRVSNVRGRDGDDILSTDDGDDFDAINGGPGMNTCSAVDGDTLIDC